MICNDSDWTSETAILVCIKLCPCLHAYVNCSRRYLYIFFVAEFAVILSLVMAQRHQFSSGRDSMSASPRRGQYFWKIAQCSSATNACMRTALPAH